VYILLCIQLPPPPSIFIAIGYHSMSSLKGGVLCKNDSNVEYFNIVSSTMIPADSYLVAVSFPVNANSSVGSRVNINVNEKTT
jgi:hypothetical protein